MRNYVVCPTCLDERHGGVNNDRTDALELAPRLDRFLAGNDKALAIVRVPTEAEEQKRARNRQRQQLREQRLSLATPPQGITLPPCGGNVRPGDDPATVSAQAPAEKSARHWRGPGEGPHFEGAAPSCETPVPPALPHRENSGGALACGSVSRFPPHFPPTGPQRTMHWFPGGRAFSDL